MPLLIPGEFNWHHGGSTNLHDYLLHPCIWIVFLANVPAPPISVTFLVTILLLAVNDLVRQLYLSFVESLAESIGNDNMSVDKSQNMTIVATEECYSKYAHPALVLH
jgi:hypothetical protein